MCQAYVCTQRGFHSLQYLPDALQSINGVHGGWLHHVRARDLPMDDSDPVAYVSDGPKGREVGHTKSFAPSFLGGGQILY